MNEEIDNLQQGIKPRCAKCKEKEAIMLVMTSFLCGDCLLEFYKFKQQEENDKMQRFITG